MSFIFSKQPTSRRALIWGIGGLFFIGVIQYMVFPLFEYRERCIRKAERARNQYASLETLTQEYRQLSEISAFPDTSKMETEQGLFALVNAEASSVGISGAIETLRPSSRGGQENGERLELRLGEVDLSQSIRWLYALEEKHRNINVESLTIRRTTRGLLTLDMILSRSKDTFY